MKTAHAALWSRALALACLLCPLAPAALRADSEVEGLRAGYVLAVERATLPTRALYEQSLAGVVAMRTRDSDLSGAMAARDDLELLRSGAFPAPSQEGGDAHLDKLRASHLAAVERAVRPLRAAYRRELRRIMEARQRSADLDGALAARAAMERAGAEAAHQIRAEPPGGGGEGLFVGTTWVSPAGTAFTFLEDGRSIRAGVRRTREGTWTREGGAVVAFVDGNPRETRYFHFLSESDAYYGNSANKIATRVRPR